MGGGNTQRCAKERRARRRLLFKEQNGRCYWCGGQMRVDVLHVKGGHVHPEFASLEHLIPESMGGSFRRGNIVLAHAGCNSARGTDTSWQPAEVFL